VVCVARPTAGSIVVVEGAAGRVVGAPVPDVGTVWEDEEAPTTLDDTAKALEVGDVVGEELAAAEVVAGRGTVVGVEAAGLVTAGMPGLEELPTVPADLGVVWPEAPVTAELAVGATVAGGLVDEVSANASGTAAVGSTRLKTMARVAAQDHTRASRVRPAMWPPRAR
jgi:hypothetical protein